MYKNQKDVVFGTIIGIVVALLVGFFINIFNHIFWLYNILGLGLLSILFIPIIIAFYIETHCWIKEYKELK